MRISLETLAAATAMVVSVAALFVAWDQSMVMRAQQHASVWPMLESDVTIDQNEETNFMLFEVSNVGVGPALIKEAKITINDQLIDNYDRFSRMSGIDKMPGSNTIRASSFTGVLGAGVNRQAFRISWDRTPESDALFRDFTLSYIGEKAPDIDLHFCYCSVFDKCWKIGKNDNTDPEEVDACVIQPEDPIESIMGTVQ